MCDLDFYSVAAFAADRLELPVKSFRSFFARKFQGMVTFFHLLFACPVFACVCVVVVLECFGSFFLAVSEYEGLRHVSLSILGLGICQVQSFFPAK